MRASGIFAVAAAAAAGHMADILAAADIRQGMLISTLLSRYRRQHTRRRSMMIFALHHQANANGSRDADAGEWLSFPRSRRLSRKSIARQQRFQASRRQAREPRPAIFAWLPK